MPVTEGGVEPMSTITTSHPTLPERIATTPPHTVVTPLQVVARPYTHGCITTIPMVAVDSGAPLGVGKTDAITTTTAHPGQSFASKEDIVFSTPPVSFRTIFASSRLSVSPEEVGGVDERMAHAILRGAPGIGDTSLDCPLRKMSSAIIRGAVQASNRRFRAREIDMMIPCMRGAGTARTSSDGKQSSICWRVRVSHCVNLWNRGGNKWPDGTALSRFNGCVVRTIVRFDRVIIGNVPECVFIVTDIESDGDPCVQEEQRGEIRKASSPRAGGLSVSNLTCLLEARDRIERLLEEHLAQQKPSLK